VAAQVKIALVREVTEVLARICIVNLQDTLNVQMGDSKRTNPFVLTRLSTAKKTRGERSVGKAVRTSIPYAQE
jgi:hypothetical protein